MLPGASVEVDRHLSWVSSSGRMVPSSRWESGTKIPVSRVSSHCSTRLPTRLAGRHSSGPASLVLHRVGNGLPAPERGGHGAQSALSQRPNRQWSGADHGRSTVCRRSRAPAATVAQPHASPRTDAAKPRLGPAAAGAVFIPRYRRSATGPRGQSHTRLRFGNRAARAVQSGLSWTLGGISCREPAGGTAG